MLQDDEKRILRAVQRDATLSARDLAERLNLSTSTVWRRMKEMEDAGVITGRVVVANPDKLGLS
ncbi:MAG TPA: winged helix-turn-helix transcriptional regulator, partial [Kiloniellaceae bacterium]|nr:winged helix-turn-helix transcriptional regulator [Kiloniellaceae bacterium]